MTRTHVVEVSRTIDAPVERAWSVITDHDLYGRLAPNLRGVQAMTPNGPGLERRCVDSLGRGWNESCTLWDEGRRFAVEVDTSDYPYPLEIMRGMWWVEPVDAHHSRAGMRFEFAARPGLWGRFFVAIMRVAFRPVVGRILRGWQREASRQKQGTR